MLQRDPVSVSFDPGARRFLDRAYSSPGQWRPTRLADPEARHLAEFGAQGINVAGPDDVSVRGRPGLNARSRWARGFVRSVYHQHTLWSGGGAGAWRTTRRRVPRSAAEIEIRVGNRVPALGVLPAGRMIHIRYDPGRPAQLARDRGEVGPHQSDLRLRDWG